MDRFVIGLMMVFMVLGALDRALLNNRLGYGSEFEKGLQTMGPLTIMMAGIMCAAPALGAALMPVLAPLFQLIGTDPGTAGGMLFGIDMGGFPLVQKMTDDPDVLLLSGVLLSSTLGVAITFTIPVGLGMCTSENRVFAVKGIVAGIIASPVSALIGGLAGGAALNTIFHTTLPAVLLAVTLAALLTLFQKQTLRFFLMFSKVLSALGTLWLASAILEELTGLTVLPGMAPLEEQLVLIGEISITLAGAYPLVKFVQKIFSPALVRFAKFFEINIPAACGMLTGIANPLLMFDLVEQMTPRGIVLSFALITPGAALLGDHLGYISAVYPSGMTAMLAGKSAAAVLAFGIAYWLESMQNKN